jgi:hypothetical protein
MARADDLDAVVEDELPAAVLAEGYLRLQIVQVHGAASLAGCAGPSGNRLYSRVDGVAFSHETIRWYHTLCGAGDG